MVLAVTSEDVSVIPQHFECIGHFAEKVYVHTIFISGSDMSKYVFGIVIVFSLLRNGIAHGQLRQDDSLSIVLRYRNTAQQIIKEAMKDSAAYSTLAFMCDAFGPRLSGSDNLERAIDWAFDQFGREHFENVYVQPVQVPRWERGHESLDLLSPQKRHLPVLGLGGSIGTPEEGLDAEVIVVKSFSDLRLHASETRGKIVLFNVPFTTYGETVQYRSRGAIEASRAGAIASLIRSVSPVSLQTPHTGSMSYADSIPKIPHAAITLEDAEMLQRMHDRGQHPRLRLKMEARTFPDASSRNVVAEIRGSELPEEIVVFGGHIDSWDVGQGAHDDGGGCVAAWQALRILQRLHLRPRRTIRLVFWTNEENGLRGGAAYAKAVEDSARHHVLAVEADAGVFRPKGFGLTGSDTLARIIGPVLSLLKSIGADTLTRSGGGVDISPLMKYKVPGMGLNVDGGKYFWYHHSDADTMDKIDPVDLNLCAAALAVVVYVIADLPFPVPH